MLDNRENLICSTEIPRNGKKYHIGYTTGVFDMFHIGHLNILRNAKELCDYLIVGVSSDEVVQSYKGKTPIICFAERIEIVSSIKYVDKVVPQYSMDKIAAWRNLHFDVLFHGSDWQDSEMYKRIEADFLKIGVDVVFLPHTPGITSTSLSEIIKKRT